MTAKRAFAAWGAAAAFVLILLLAWLAYRPGLSGGFLFDDFSNMPVLGYYGRIDNWTAFWLYITSGSADPTGRPIALLSFLIDANNWPADPYAFKYTGVLLHLLNGALLTLLLLRVGRATGHPESVAVPAAILGASLWLLHPLLISTTLYIVQRETVLAGTFVLLGLLGYCRGRELARRGRIGGVWLAGAAVLAGAVLAALSKANGALLPLLVLVVEDVLLAPVSRVDSPRTCRSFRRMRFSVLILPSILLGAFLGWKTYSGFVNGMPATMPWTLGERLMTEARVLTDYLYSLWLPRAFNHGLFHDDLIASTGLFSPASTFFCVLLVLALIASAWALRRRLPTLSVALIFFFAGHLLESTVIPLELYFEHRNYVPSLLMFWPLALWISGGAASVHSPLPSSSLRVLRIALAFVFPLALAGLTFLGASLWGNVRDQALLWARQNPLSSRAQAIAAQIELTRGNAAAAAARLDHALAKNPYDLQLLLSLISARCSTRTGITETDVVRTQTAMRITRNAGNIGSDWFDRSLAVTQAGSCPGLTVDVLDRLLSASSENLHLKEFAPRFVQDRIRLQARIALLRNQNERALSLFNAAFDADPRPDAAMLQAALLGTAGQPQLALRHLDHLAQTWHSPPDAGWSMPSLHAWLLWKSGYWDNELVHLRKTLVQDIAEQQATQLPSSKSDL